MTSDADVADASGSVVDAAARSRKIVHVDMDAFFASVEQRDNPELRGLPVAVGGSRDRGVVAAASYEARVFGVRSAMPSVTARRKCPDLIFVKPRFDAYKAVSMQIRGIFAEHTSIIEPLSLDEAYLDVTENIQGIPLATEVASMIRAKILAETGLTASAGISYNKFLAKLASDHRKPNGQYVITPRMGPSFVETLPIGRFHGVGPATEAKMHRLGIRLGRRPQDEVIGVPAAAFRKVGRIFLRDRARRQSPSGARRPHPQVHRRREHILGRPRRLRAHARSFAAARTRPRLPDAKRWRRLASAFWRGRCRCRAACVCWASAFRTYNRVDRSDTRRCSRARADHIGPMPTVRGGRRPSSSSVRATPLQARRLVDPALQHVGSDIRRVADRGGSARSIVGAPLPARRTVLGVVERAGARMSRRLVDLRAPFDDRLRRLPRVEREGWRCQR